MRADCARATAKLGAHRVGRAAPAHVHVAAVGKGAARALAARGANQIGHCVFLARAAVAARVARRASVHQEKRDRCDDQQQQRRERRHWQAIRLRALASASASVRG